MPNFCSTCRVFLHCFSLGEKFGIAKHVYRFRFCMGLIMFAAGLELAEAAAVEYSPEAANAQGAIYFQTPIYATNDGTAVSILVVRNDTQNEATIHYATSDGTATTDVDYTPTSGDLTFAVGQSSAYFWVSTLTRYTGDTTDKTVLLSLSNPSANAVLGSPATAVMTIHDSQVSMPEYFPLSNGSDWHLLANGVFSIQCKIAFETVVVNQIKTHTLICPPDGNKQNYTSDTQGIRLHRFYYPKLVMPKLGARKVSMVANPPITMSEANAKIGQSFNSNGEFRTSVSGLGFTSVPYSATHTIQGYDTITVPAGTFEVIKLEGEIAIGNQAPLVQTYYLAKRIGIVKQETPGAATPVTLELVSTNTLIHDMAVTGIVPPVKVALSASKSTLTKNVKVNIQNRGPLMETIADLDSLQRFVRLDIESLGDCPAPIAQMQTAALQKRMPINLKAKQILSVDFAVTFNCANDLEANTATNLAHEDYRYSAAVNHSALDGSADVHKADDTCPRSVKLPYMLDENPDGTIKDYGCGAKKPDKTFGAAVTTDITRP